MIDEILKKAVNNKKISDDEFLQLLKINKEEDLKKLCETAVSIRNKHSKLIKLTSTVHITNKCTIQPRCKYCGFAPKTSTEDIMNLFIKQMKKYLKLQYPLKKRGSLE